MKAEAIKPAQTSVDARIIDAVVRNDAAGMDELSQYGISREAMYARARTLGLTDRILKECEVSGSTPAMRRCVACDISFLSTGAHNRLCRRCPR